MLCVQDICELYIFLLILFNNQEYNTHQEGVLSVFSTRHRTKVIYFIGHAQVSGLDAETFMSLNISSSSRLNSFVLIFFLNRNVQYLNFFFLKCILKAYDTLDRDGDKYYQIVLDKINEKRQLRKCIQSRRDDKTRESLLKTIIKDVEKHSRRERLRVEYTTEIMTDMNKGKYNKLKELCCN